MTSTDTLLKTFQPVLKYDSQEAYFADSAAEWTDNPGNVLLDGAGHQLAAAGSGLTLQLLGQMVSDGKATNNDVISDPRSDYAAEAAKLHTNVGYANQIYGHAVVEDGALWLQYWFFYFYNDYNLIGPLIKAGLHEGDWEMIQLRVPGGAETPDLAVYAQHAHAESRDWRQVDLMPGTSRPIVYPARGSHASYFEPGIQWTGFWFDFADGKRRSPDQALELVRDDDPQWAWIRWPGFWGDTKAGELPIDSTSPRGPGGHAQWDHPSALLEKPPPAPPPAGAGTLPAPSARAEWNGTAVRVLYGTDPGPGGRAATGIVVTVNSPDEPSPPRTVTFPIKAASGEVDVTGLDPAHRYDLYVSAAAAGNPPLASASVRVDLAAAS